MPTRNINLTEHFDRFIDAEVESGRYGSACEVVREGLRLMERANAQRRPNSGGFAALSRQVWMRSAGVKAWSFARAENSTATSTIWANKPLPNSKITVVHERGGRARVILAPAAERDIRAALRWSHERFGERAAARYRALIKQAPADIADDPERAGSQHRPELVRGVRTYHLLFSRDRARSHLAGVRSPRHFVIYRRRAEDVIDILRVLHDAREIERHLPGMPGEIEN